MSEMGDTETAMIGSEPVNGRITDKAVEDARALVGSILRPEGPYLQDVTIDTLRNFANGIGDLNPMFRDAEYGRATRFGSMIGHPMFPYAFGWPGRSRWGLPGVHGFYAGNDWEYFRTIKPGSRVSCVERIVGVERKTSKFSRELVMQYVQASFVNERDELISQVLGVTTRHEREAARSQGKYADTAVAEYSAAELEKIDAAVLSERDVIRAGRVRYWEDVVLGEELPPIARGPLSLMDTIGFLVGVGRGHTHGLVLEAAQKHPDHYFRNPDSRGGLEYTGIGHHRDTIARDVGAPGTYDYGPQRTAWLATLVTNWMGDAGFLKRVRAEMRRFNMVGDTTWCKGKVTRKYVKDGYGLVDLNIWAENQRGEVTTPGLATVVLPSRDVATKPVLDGSGISLDLPVVR